MRDRTFISIGIASVTVLMIESGSASAALTGTKDSALFPTKYEANVDAQFPESDPSFAWNRSATDGNPTATVSGGDLQYIADSGNDRIYWEYPGWDGSSYPDGYTIEANVKINAQDPVNGAFNIVVGDGSRLAVFAFFTDKITYRPVGGGTANVISGIDNSDTFHSFRIARDPADGLLEIWRDGTQIFTDLTPNASAADTFYWGDASDSETYGDYQLDYMRVDTGGSYAPIPEPGMMLSTLAMAAAAGLVRRRRNVG